jgi:hypothetical protein
MFGKIKTTTEPKEKLVIISDNGTADIANVYDIDHERIAGSSSTAEYSVPIADVKAYAGSRGIIYIYPATHENVEDTQRLAALEKSIVLQQVTHYVKPDPEASKMTFMKLFPYILIFLLVIIVAVK